MLAYAADRQRIAQRRPAPQAMLAIIVAHIALIAAVMSAKMEIPQRIIGGRTTVDLIKLPKPPPEPSAQPNRRNSRIDRPVILVPLPQLAPNPFVPTPLPLPLGGGVIGPEPLPTPELPRPAEIVRTGPRLATPASALRPPYPAAKLDREEEAVLKLRLAIDESGRVTAVTPLGRADPVFLDAARRHLIARWRYQPAMDGARAVASSTQITLRFELN